SASRKVASSQRRGGPARCWKHVAGPDHRNLDERFQWLNRKLSRFLSACHATKRRHSPNSSNVSAMTTVSGFRAGSFSTAAGRSKTRWGPRYTCYGPRWRKLASRRDDRELAMPVHIPPKLPPASPMIISQSPTHIVVAFEISRTELARH